MNLIRNISIRTKLMTSALLIIVPVIIILTVLNVKRETATLRLEMENNIQTVARLTAEYCIPDLEFNDKESGKRSLSNIRNTPTIDEALLFDNDKTLFAGFERHPFKMANYNGPELLTNKGFAGGYYYYSCPVVFEGRNIGFLFIRASTEHLTRNINKQTAINIGIMMGLILISFVLIYVTQQFIVGPILNLAQVSHKVAATGNYSIRGKVESQDEVGNLVSEFNQMLNTIQKTTVSKNFVDKIIAGLLDTLFITNKDDIIIEANQAAFNLIDGKSTDVIGKKMRDVLVLPEQLRENKFEESKLLRLNGETIPVEFSMTRIDDSNKVWVIHDIREQKSHEAQIKKTLEEKEILLREIHHRVKNNLQVIVSLLNMQARNAENEETIQALNICIDRIRSMALIHSKLYSKTSDFVSIDLREYIDQLGTEILKTYSVNKNIELKVHSDIKEFNLPTLMPIGLILNELISNSLKYAFQSKDNGLIEITITNKQDKEFELLYCDNGTGLPEGIDWKNMESLGLQLVQIFTEQLQGEVSYEGGKDGTCFRFRMHRQG